MGMLTLASFKKQAQNIKHFYIGEEKMTQAIELFKNHIDYVWIRPEILEADYGDIVQEDWFIHTLLNHGNPFSEAFMSKVWECMDSFPQIFDLDMGDAETVLDYYFQAWFADNDLSKTLHAVENEY